MSLYSRIITDLLKATDSKEVLSGVQLLGVLVANKIEPYNASLAASVGKQEYVLCSGDLFSTEYSKKSKKIKFFISFGTRNGKIGSTVLNVRYGVHLDFILSALTKD